MTMQSVGLSYWPLLQIQGGPQSIGFGISNIAFDSATDRLAWVGSLPYSDTIAALYLRTNNVVTGCTLDVRIESLTNVRPSGSLIAAGANASVVVADGDDNVFKTATISTPPSITPTTLFAIVAVVGSGTPNMNLSGFPGGVSSAPSLAHFPLSLQDTGAGTWAALGNGFNWIVQLGTAGIVPVTNFSPMNGTGTITAFNSGTSPNERMLKFVPLVKRRIIGIRAAMFNMAAGSDCTFSLWDATGDTDGEALGQASLDGDFALSTTQDGFVDQYFASPVTPTVGGTYYAGVRADTANNVGLGEIAVPAGVTNAKLALAGVDSSVMLSTRSWSGGTAGAKTDTSTTVPLIYLIYDQTDDGAGGSGAAQLVSGGLVQ